MTDEQRLQMITEQLILVRDNLFRGMSKSIQKLQARSINELLELPSHTQSPPAQQEPVAKVCHDLDGHIGWNPNLRQLPDEGTALYTSPPAQRTWVGLTDEEISKMPAWIYSPDQDGMTAEEGLEVFARAIEAKLRSKNEDRN